MIVEGETGYIVPVGDVTAIADRVMALLENPDRAVAFGRRGRRIVEGRFSREAQLIAVEALYARLFSQLHERRKRTA
jgi:glycosyltransferase involved in cell wall biosynthesis